jgi:hypothetical protein
VPIQLAPDYLLQDARAGVNEDLVSTATHIIAFEVGGSYKIIGNFGAGAGTIDYYGITSWALTDVFTGTATEVFNPAVEPILIELACAIADEQSNLDTLAFAKKLLNKGE